MMQFLMVAIGGALGSIIRYAISLQLTQHKWHGLPISATLLVNLLGSFLIGFAFVVLAKQQHINVLLVTGFLGGFTTFSAFSLENFQLIQGGEIQAALINIAVQVIGGLCLVFCGFAVAKLCWPNL